MLMIFIYGYSCVGVKGFRSVSESHVMLIYIDTVRLMEHSFIRTLC